MRVLQSKLHYLETILKFSKLIPRSETRLLHHLALVRTDFIKSGLAAASSLVLQEVIHINRVLGI